MVNRRCIASRSLTVGGVCQIILCVLIAAVGSIPFSYCRGQELSAVPTLGDVRPNESIESIVLGGGCFWCVEAVYQRVHGVRSVVSGYSGGHVENPTYAQVSTELTGHAEVCKIDFDIKIISLDEILEIFWKSHDPTTRNRQGIDEGTRYRSVVFCSNDEQLKIAQEHLEKLKKARTYRRPIVTEIQLLDEFYPAEAYHQNYFRNHPDEAYCQNFIVPKVGKFERTFKKYSAKAQSEKDKK